MKYTKLLALVLALLIALVGCVHYEKRPEDEQPSKEREEAPMEDQNQEPAKQTDQNGFSNEPEENATKRY